MLKHHNKPSLDVAASAIPDKKGTRWSNKTTFLICGLIFVALVTAVAVYSSYELFKTKRPDYQQKLLAKQTKDIITAVGKLIELPADTPQIATVSDVELLKKDQPFFERAKNGDQLLVFQTEAILYRPGLGKIINVAAVNRQQPQPTVSNVSSPAVKRPTINE